MIVRVNRGGYGLAGLGGLGCLLGLLAGCVQFEKNDEGPAGAEAAEDPDADDDEDEADEAEEADDSADDDAATTAVPTTGGGEDAGECDLWAQDCPAGSKCAPHDKNNDGIHDAARCVPIDDAPGQPGDDCTIEGSLASGVDTCGLGMMCWLTNAANQGSCVAMCTGSPEEPNCEMGLICDISNGGVLLLCVQPCDPLAPSCPMGQICLPGGEKQFICDVDASGDQGGYGDPCAYVNVCDQGLLCVAGESVPGCKTDGCCTEYCDLSEGGANCAGAPEQECAPFYEKGAAPPGYEDVGVCTVPK